jgi:hypothetical protein
MVDLKIPPEDIVLRVVDGGGAEITLLTTRPPGKNAEIALRISNKRMPLRIVLAVRRWVDHSEKIPIIANSP